MSRALLASSFRRFVVPTLLLSCAALSRAENKPARNYAETGSVLATISKHGHFYQVSTESRIYLFLCDRVKSFQLGQAECKIGDKPIATGDTIHFRLEGDWAYMAPMSKGKPDAKPDAAAAESADAMEEKLRILTTELKVIPALPAAAAPSTAAAEEKPAKAKKQKPTPISKPAVVVGSGLHLKGQHGVGWSTTPGAANSITTASAATPVMATGPVTAIPVTGGPPVMVMPTGPVGGGVVTGVPVTGGAPITAIPTGPVMGIPMGGGATTGGATGGGMVMMGGGSRPQWVHVLRIQTAGKIYQLECSSKRCKLVDREIALGDGLTLRAEKKHAYLSANPPVPGGEQEYKILNVTDAGSTPAAPKTE